MAVAKLLKTRASECWPILTCPQIESVVRQDGPDARLATPASAEAVDYVEVRAHIAALDCTPQQGANRLMDWAKLRAKLTVLVEAVDGELSILADLYDVTVGVAHVTTRFPAVTIG